jgi:hypothetical protein
MYPPAGWKPEHNQAAYCTDSSAQSAGGGYCQFNRMTYTANASARDQVETYWPAFRAAVSGGNVTSIMCSYNAVTMGGDQAADISGGTPSCANKNYLRGVLREQWGWKDGFVVSDCQAIAIIKAGHGFRTDEDPKAVPKSQIHGNTDKSDYVDAARQAIRASTDFNCGQAYIGFLEDVVVDGSVNESLVDESLTRMYLLMHRLGIFDATQQYGQIGPADIDTPHHRAIAREAAAQALTLLKNEETAAGAKRLLPLKIPSAGHKLAVIGPLANATLGMLSNYHPNADMVPVAMQHSPLQALLSRSPAGAIEYVRGTEVECETPRYCNAADRANISAAAVVAKRADTVLLFLGMNSNGNNGTGRLHGGDGSSESEAKDRFDIALRGVQQELLAAVVAANQRTVVVLMNAGCLAIDASLMPAILEVYYPGELGGEAVADVLTGVVSPAGRLPLTYYPASFVDERPMQEYDTRGHGGITYRFYQKTPLWQFGFGLSYTTFRFALDEQASRLTASTADMHEAHAAYYRRGGGNDPHAPLLCAVNVTNTGTVGSDVVVLGFLRNPTALAAEDHPLKELFSFERLKMLPAGATTQVLLSIPAQVISLVDAAGTERLVAADYPLELGVDGSAEGQAVRGGKLVLTGAARTLFEMPNFSSST